MKICMVGLGSMGTRHLRNLTGLLQKRGEAFSIDALRSGKAAALPDEVSTLIHREYFGARELPNDYDVLFICNPTALHFDTIQALIPKTKHMFIEKPVFDRVDIDLAALSLPKSAIYYVACPMRYTRVVQQLKQIVAKTRVFSVRVICSTYLPDWRPGTDYRSNYSAKKELGGGVAIDLIHEWDYLTYLFGLPKSVLMRQGKYSNLEIDSEDLALYIGEYQDKLVSVQLDYFGRFSKREIELYTADDVVVGDFINQEIRYLKSGQITSLLETRDEYQTRELENFLQIIAGEKTNENTLERALAVLNITKGSGER